MFSAGATQVSVAVPIEELLDPVEVVDAVLESNLQPPNADAMTTKAAI